MTKRNVLSLVLATCLAVSSASVWGADSTVLRLDVLSWTWGPTSRTGQTSRDLTITKTFDTSSATLAAYATQGHVIPTVVLTPPNGKALALVLSGVRVVNVDHGKTEGIAMSRIQTRC